MTKKFVSMFLALVMCLSLAAPAWAAENTENKEAAISLNDYIDYANRELTSLSLLSDVDLTLDDLFISQPFEMLNDNDDTNYAFFLFQSGHCIGELVVSHYTGSFSSSFLPEELPLVYFAYVNSTPVCFVSTGSSLLMCSETECELVVGNLRYFDLLETNAVDAAISCAKKEVISLLSVCPVDEPIPFTTPGSSKILPVPFVTNVGINNRGVCWAAATASIIAYRDPACADLTATDVYDTVILNGGDAVGSQKDVVLALDCFGIAGYMGVDNSLPSSMVINQIDAYYPIYIAISGVSSAGGSVYHAVTICGYEYQNSLNDYYVIMDPNVESKVYISINRYTNVFTYTTAWGSVYTDWYRTVCHPM